MTEPVAVDAAHFLEFIGGSRLAVILVSVHPLHTFSRPLARQLAAEHPDIALGTIHLYDLIVEGGPALRFLHEGLRSCGAPSALGVVPGYCLFRAGELLAWDAGLPTFGDVEAMARSALLGVIWSGLTHDAAFVRQALHLAADQVAAQRIAVRFRHILADGAGRPAPDPPRPPPIEDLAWAYQLLGVPPTATDREVHEAWRKKRMEAHPDHAAQNPAEFDRRHRLSVEINRARDIIVNHRAGEARRARHSAS